MRSAQWRDQRFFIYVSYERASSTAPWQEARRGIHENQVDLVPTSVAKDAALAHFGTTGGKSSSHWVALPNKKRSLNTWTLVLNCVQQKVLNHPGHLQGGQVQVQVVVPYNQVFVTASRKVCSSLWSLEGLQVSVRV